MTALIALLALAAVSWLYRVMFTAVVDGDRLPAGLRARMDAVGPAAFAALVASKVAGTPTGELLPVVAAIVAAGVTARRTGNHLAAMVAAVVAWMLASVV